MREHPDYHVIDAAAVHDAMTFLLENLPPQVTLAMTTRADPPLQLSRLRARGELLELRAAERFTTELDSPPADGHRRVQRRRLRCRGALLDRRAAARTVTFPDTDIAAVGRGYGLEAITVRAVSDVADVRPWLEEAFSGH
jgi:hypothetical protein